MVVAAEEVAVVVGGRWKESQLNLVPWVWGWGRLKWNQNGKPS